MWTVTKELQDDYWFVKIYVPQINASYFLRVIFSTLHLVEGKYQQKTEYFTVSSNCNYTDLCAFKMTAEIIKLGTDPCGSDVSQVVMEL